LKTVRKESIDIHGKCERLTGSIRANLTDYRSGIPTIGSRLIRATMASLLLLLTAIMIQPAPAHGQSNPMPAYSENLLFSFADGVDGASPAGGLRRDSANNLYGTTTSGGDFNCGEGNAGCGTVFKVDPSGNLTVLHTFAGSTDGAWPVAGLVFDPAQQYLYGTTSSGGNVSGCNGLGCGLVFKTDTNGNESVLHTFAGGTSDGAHPSADLIVGSNDNVYGTTAFGGANGDGIVFKIDSSGSETVLHSFSGGKTDGAGPWGAVILDKAGNLYGTTTEGGTYDQGVVFKVSTSGNETILHSFRGGSNDGCYPSGNLVLDASNNLYGTAQWCGAHGNGVVWKVAKNGVETLLHSFNGSADGQSPYGGVIIDPQRNLYGGAQFGGAKGWGTIFEVSSSGKTTVLHTFGTGNDGQDPEGGLIRDQQGNLYGTTSLGGSSGGYGTVFKLTR
jgi:uncharacterized repeat protein (TIGR03803 family)